MPSWTEYFGFLPPDDDHQTRAHNIGLAIFYAVLIGGAAIALWSKFN